MQSDQLCPGFFCLQAWPAANCFCTACLVLSFVAPKGRVSNYCSSVQAMENRNAYLPRALSVLANKATVNLIKAAGSCGVSGTVI